MKNEEKKTEPWYLWENINCTKIDIIMEVSEGKKTEKIAEGIFEEIIV